MGKTKVCLSCGDLTDDGGVFCSSCRKTTRGGLCKRIMVFTMDPEIIMVVKEEFTKRGCTVQGEKDLDKATLMMKRDVPNLVILDTETAATIGMELAAEIKASQFGIKLIVLSNSEKSRAIFEKMKVDYFFVKPMDKVTFMKACAMLLIGKETLD